MTVRDRLGRPLRNLRLSVTDRCNLRCGYCMPEAEYVWLARRDLLTFEEISRLVDVFVAAGVDKVRLTGGEPLLRRDLARLVALLAAKPGVRDLALTTNGILLAEQAAALKEAGLGRVTVSLDTLRAERFRQISRSDNLPRVLEAVRTAVALFGTAKIDTVVMRGTNDDEMIDLVEFGRGLGVEVRFIEYMDVAGATRWSSDLVVTRAEMLERLAARYGPVRPIDERSAAPADRFAFPDGTSFGIVASTSAPFCRTCDRSRLTADGMWYRCLYAEDGTDLRAPLRAGASDAELQALIESAWQARDDRGAEERAGLADRRTFVALDRLRRDPHLEMHTRGG